MSRHPEDDLAELGGARAGALWPWMLFAAALLAGIVSFFVYTPR
jgi:hypothetical protein